MFSETELETLAEAMGRYIDLVGSDPHLEAIMAKLNGDEYTIPEFTFGVGWSTQYEAKFLFATKKGNTYLDDSFTEDQANAIQAAFNQFGLGQYGECMECIIELPDIYDTDAVREKLKTLPNWHYDADFEQRMLEGV